MKKYKTVEVTEKQLEDLIRQGADLIEEGLRYIDHQIMTDRGPLDILMVDSRNALVIAELKVVEDDTMLIQGIDYYDCVSRNVHALAATYKDFGIEAEKAPRLLLIAPSFPVTLLNRCKWIDIRISLSTFKCIAFEGSDEIIPVFSDVTIPSIPKPPVKVTLEDHLDYITDPEVRRTVENLLQEVREWDKDQIVTEPTIYYISMKISGKLFAALYTRRKHFIIDTSDTENEWTRYTIATNEDLTNVKALLRANTEQT